MELPCFTTGISVAINFLSHIFVYFVAISLNSLSEVSCFRFRSFTSYRKHSSTGMYLNTLILESRNQNGFVLAGYREWLIGWAVYMG